MEPKFLEIRDQEMYSFVGLNLIISFIVIMNYNGLTILINIVNYNGRPGLPENVRQGGWAFVYMHCLNNPKPTHLLSLNFIFLASM